MRRYNWIWPTNCAQPICMPRYLPSWILDAVLPAPPNLPVASSRPVESRPRKISTIWKTLRWPAKIYQRSYQTKSKLVEQNLTALNHSSSYQALQKNSISQHQCATNASKLYPSQQMLATLNQSLITAIFYSDLVLTEISYDLAYQMERSKPSAWQLVSA